MKVSIGTPRRFLRKLTSGIICRENSPSLIVTSRENEIYKYTLKNNRLAWDFHCLFECFNGWYWMDELLLWFSNKYLYDTSRIATDHITESINRWLYHYYGLRGYFPKVRKWPSCYDCEGICISRLHHTMSLVSAAAIRRLVNSRAQIWANLCSILMRLHLNDVTISHDVIMITNYWIHLSMVGLTERSDILMTVTITIIYPP